MWGAIIPAAVSAIGGLIGAKSTNSAQDVRQEDTQQFNAQEAQKQRDFEAAQVKQQLDFQERMSNSAYQRAMGDMKTAGLNPLLAYSQGGASTPSGAAAHGSSASSPAPLPVINKAAAASDAAAKTMASAQQLAAIENTEAATKKTQAETAKTWLDYEIANDQDQWEREPGENGRLRPKLDAEGKPIPRRHHFTVNEATRIQTIVNREKALLTQQERNLVEEQIKNAVEEGERIKATTGNVNADTFLKQMEGVPAEQAAKFWKGIGEGGPYAQGLKFLAPILHSARHVFGR